MTFLPDLATLMAYAVASVILFATPGPDMSLFLARTIAGGRGHGMASVLGANLGCLVHTLAAAIGLSALIAASTTAFTTLKIVGALYLLWLAVDALRHGSALSVTEGAPVPPSIMRTFLMGVGVNITNPKVILFFITFLPQFIDVSDPHATGKMVFLGIFFVVINIPFSILMILGAERLVGYLKSRPTVLRALDWTFAGFFGFLAVKILATESR